MLVNPSVYRVCKGGHTVGSYICPSPITSPLVNRRVAVAMFAGTFGWKITGVYIASGILMGVIEA